VINGHPVFADPSRHRIGVREIGHRRLGRHTGQFEDLEREGKRIMVKDAPAVDTDQAVKAAAAEQISTVHSKQ
jgi:hypothetical protein